MTLPTSIGASQYAALTVATGAVPAVKSEANFVALFDTALEHDEIKNIRDMPTIGTPANVVKVPVYGQALTQSVGAQADAPDLELTLNYIPADWAPGTTLGDYVGDGVSKVFQISFLRAEPDSIDAVAAGLGTVENANFYFVGKIESLLTSPNRDDADTATLALSLQSDFYGPYTIDP